MSTGFLGEKMAHACSNSSLPEKHRKNDRLSLSSLMWLREKKSSTLVMNVLHLSLLGTKVGKLPKYSLRGFKSSVSSSFFESSFFEASPLPSVFMLLSSSSLEVSEL